MITIPLEEPPSAALGLDEGRRRQLVRGETLFSPGEFPDFVFRLESGLVKICAPEAFSGRDAVLDLIRPGQIFGIKQALLGTAHTSSAKCLADGGVFEIPTEMFIGRCESEPAMWRSVAQHLGEQQETLHRRIDMLIRRDVEYRLATTLLDLAESFGPEQTGDYVIPLSQEDFADLVGATRETASGKLNQFQKKRLVRLGRRRVVIARLEPLRALLDVNQRPRRD